MSTARGYLAGAGSQTLSLAFGKYPAGAQTEEFTGETSALNIKTVDTTNI